MMYLLDTNVISETIKITPNQNVLAWLSSIPMSKFCLSVLSLGEIRKGIEKLANAPKKQKIILWLETDLINQFNGRILDIDSQVADKWGYISSFNNIPAVDGLIAATALAHNLKLITRNVRDFQILGLEVINPWILDR